MDKAASMVSLIEELKAREAAARVRLEALEAQIARLTARLEVGREAWSRLREAAAEVVAEMSGSRGSDVAPVPKEPVESTVVSDQPRGGDHGAALA